MRKYVELNFKEVCFRGFAISVLFHQSAQQIKQTYNSFLATHAIYIYIYFTLFFNIEIINTSKLYFIRGVPE